MVTEVALDKRPTSVIITTQALQIEYHVNNSENEMIFSLLMITN
jgi:hypothetical protein